MIVHFIFYLAFKHPQSHSKLSQNKSALTTETCITILKNSTHKFHNLWGRIAYLYKNAEGNEACWSNKNNFFHEVLGQEQCDVNWLRGASDTEAFRPPFTKDAPALLGFDNTIVDYCTEKSHQSNWPQGDYFKEVARRCVQGNQNILLMFSCDSCFGFQGWDMCQNLRWVLCAVRNFLPGQGSSGVRFAKAPKNLNFSDFDKVTNRKHYVVSDVFFCEVCVISLICKNSWQLFLLNRGERFDCEFDEKGYWNLVKTLQK